METHDSTEHPESGNLKDSAKFRELADLMKKIPLDRREDAFEAADSPPELKLFNENATEDTDDTTAADDLGSTAESN